MKKLIILLLFQVASVFSQSKYDTGKLVLEVTIKSFGKCKPLDDDFYKITGLKKEDVTSAFYVIAGNAKDVIVIPINDKVFNYNYFNANIYSSNMNGKQVKLIVKEYEINHHKIHVACKVQ